MSASAPAPVTPREGVDHAVGAAAESQRQVDWREGAPQAGWMTGLADALDAEAAQLVRLAVRETALPEQRLVGEVARTSGQLRFLAAGASRGAFLDARLDSRDPSTTPPRPDLRSQLAPMGVVGVFAASNFPFAFSVLGGDTASALAAGCSVVVKAHEGHPELSRRTAAIADEALTAAGAPPALLGVVEGRECGALLVQHPSVRAVGFTGSLAGGRALALLASQRPDPVPFYGELGSINPVVVLPAAAQERPEGLARELVAVISASLGQLCTKPGLVFVPARCRIPHLVGQVVADVAGGPLLTRGIGDAFEAAADRRRDLAGVSMTSGRGGPGASATVYTCDLATYREHAEELGTECFGPTCVLVEYDEVAEVVQALEAHTGSLTGSLHTGAAGAGSDDAVRVWRALERISGRVVHDGWPPGTAVTWAQHHGGPWPSATLPFTSVGAGAVRRFQRPIAYQEAPDPLLPAALRDGNPLGVERLVDGVPSPALVRRSDG